MIPIGKHRLTFKRHHALTRKTHLTMNNHLRFCCKRIKIFIN